MSAEDEKDASLHVHFPDDDEESGDRVDDKKSIRVQPSGADRALVHLGFMQVHHRYSVEFALPRDLLPAGEHVSQEETEPPCLNCRLIDANDDLGGEGVKVKVEFSAVKAKLQKETIVLVANDANGEVAKRLTLVLQARVLGK